MSMNELFTTTTEEQTSARALTGTAQLTSVATDIANKMLETINSNIDEHKAQLLESQKNHDVMDALINKVFDLKSIDISFLKENDPQILENMLKSQQSKRSRAKSKQMTLDNYKTMLVGAIAENLIRLATGQEKTAGGRRGSGSLVYTDEELEAFKNDQELLKKELRNVQSKKSIAKSKADFDPEGERWAQLLVAEAQLKELRVVAPKTIKVDDVKVKLVEILGGVEVEKLKATDSKQLLEEITELIK